MNLSENNKVEGIKIEEANSTPKRTKLPRPYPPEVGSEIGGVQLAVFRSKNTDSRMYESFHYASAICELRMTSLHVISIIN